MKKTPTQVVGDTAHDLAADIKTDLANLRDDALKVATDVLAPRARDLADYLGPRVRDAAENVADYVQPRAQDLGRRGVRFASDTRESLQPRIEQFAADARDSIAPRIASFASDARDNVQPYLEDARERLQPHVADAYARIQPLVETGREKFASDVLPHLTDAIDNVSALPQTQDAMDRLAAARAALVGELTLPAAAEIVVEGKKKKGVVKTLVQVVLAGGLLAGVIYAIKRFLAPEDSGWQAHEPSEAYRRDDTSVADAPTRLVSEDAASEVDAADDEPVADAAPSDDQADPFAVSPWGEGSYVGTEPGPDFVIKGNDRSMKYHVKGAGGYERTIADVWFNSEEAAQAAGFTRAQR